METSTAATALAGTAALSAYLNGKFHIHKDLMHYYYQRRGQKHQERLKRESKINIWDTFTENCQRFAEQDCIWYSDPLTTPPTIRIFTWRQSYQYACQYAQWFLSRGVQPGECVGFYLQNSPDFVLAWMGLLGIGCYPSFINYNLVGGALAHCAKIAECKLLLVDEDIQDRVFECEELKALGIRIEVIDQAFRDTILSFKPTVPDAKYTEDAGETTRLALRYTSGTTGFPKGVMARTGRYYDRVAAQFTEMGLRPLKENQPGAGDRWYVCMPMCHATAGSGTLISLMVPTTVCIGKRFSATRFWDEVRASRATGATYVGEIARYLLALPPSPLDQQHELRMMYGNGLRPDVWKRFQDRFAIKRICEFYGSTEGGLTHLVIQEGDFLRNAVGHHGLIRRFRLRNEWIPVLVDAETNELVRDPKTGFGIRMPYDVGGELLFRLDSEANFIGYYKNREATEKKFARNVFRKGDLYYRSGDSLKRTPDGKWSFLDRLGDTFRWKGENVSTAEVSECLGKFPGVVDANVYGVEVPNHDGRAGCAALFLDPAVAGNFDLDGLLRHARKDLPNYAIPLFLRIVSQAALNANGLKQDKVQPRIEGVDPSKVQGDQLRVLKGDRYVPFTATNWDDLTTAKARL